MFFVINNAIVIKKNASKIQKFYVLQVVFSSLKFVGIAFVSSSYDSSHVESSIMLAKYFSFSQLHVVGF